ncbi:TonB-dependent receptor [Candidimonas nitroreducens]|uniref:TonB-dependent siderophore receptor n=1 Tax=Candidimonas nitroreducens TaxID=683354 RepID=A0A225M2U8_9BURK|nr:TonB-dependent receptor [Candidimonas nitroreducens]OWT55657.1 TonB-dependent siderophore receptor [Candidimonas nitroreducens]
MRIPLRRVSSPSARRVSNFAVCASLLLGGAGLLHSAVAAAQSRAAEVVHFAIPAGSLASALDSYARASHVNISYDAALVAHARTGGLNGAYSVASGLARLLAGTGLAADRQPEGGYVLRAAPEGAVTQLSTVTVKASPVVDAVIPYAGGQVNIGAALGLLGGKDIMDSPFNVTSYSSQLITDQQARTVGAVVENDPSIRVSSPPGGMFQDFTVRGFYQDSLAVNGLYGLWFGESIPTAIADRVDVVKGPTALIAGMSPSGAVGGLIDVHTKRATDDPLTRLAVDYTSDRQVGTHVDLGRRFGDEQQFGVRLNGVYRDGDTAIDHNSNRLALGALGLDYRGTRLRASLDVTTQSSAVDGYPRYIGFAGTSVPDAPRNSVNPFAGSAYRSNTTMALGRVEYDVADHWTAYVTGGVSSNRATMAGINAIGGVDPYGNFTATALNGRLSKDGESGEAGLSGSFRTGAVSHKLSLAVDGVRTKIGSNYLNGETMKSNIYDPVDFDFANNLPGEARLTTRTTLRGIALADTLGIMDDRIQLTVGGRRQWVKTENFNAAGARTAEYDDSALTPMVGLVVKPWKSVSLYANYIEGLTPGTTVSDITAANYGSTFAPYKSKQYEAGVKWDLGHVTNTLSVFQIDKPSLIKDPVTTVYSADGKQRNRGVEWNIFGEIRPGLRILGGASYTQAVIRKSAGNTYNGNQAFGVPKWLANAGVEWDLPWMHGMSVNARAIYTGSMEINTANTQNIPSWVRYDAGLRYATHIAGKPVTLRFDVQNLFNKSYWIGETYLSGFVIKSYPRTFLLSASIDF